MVQCNTSRHFTQCLYFTCPNKTQKRVAQPAKISWLHN